DESTLSRATDIARDLGRSRRSGTLDALARGADARALALPLDGLEPEGAPHEPRDERRLPPVQPLRAARHRPQHGERRAEARPHRVGRADGDDPRGLPEPEHAAGEGHREHEGRESSTGADAGAEGRRPDRLEHRRGEQEDPGLVARRLAVHAPGAHESTFSPTTQATSPAMSTTRSTEARSRPETIAHTAVSD